MKSLYPYDDFLRRVCAYETVLKEHGIDFTPVENLDCTPEEAAQALLKMLLGFGAAPGGGQTAKASSKEPVISPDLVHIGKFFLTNSLMYSYTKEEKAYILERVAEAKHLPEEARKILFAD